MKDIVDLKHQISLLVFWGLHYNRIQIGCDIFLTQVGYFLNTKEKHMRHFKWIYAMQLVSPRSFMHL